MTSVDQQTRRRIGRVGLTAYDPQKACPGYVLYTPMASRGDMYLIDVEGNVAHQWRLPYPPGLYGYLLPDGNLFYGGKVQDETWDRFPSWKRFKGGVMIEADRHGNVVWEHRDPDHHHDHRRTESGGALYMTLELMDPSLAAKVQGGVPGSAPEGMWADVLVQVDADGNRIWEWHAAEHLDVDRHIITMNDRRDEWSHGNTLAPIGDDRVLFSFRNISTVGIVDKASGKIVWELGYETLAQQHDPNMLPNGNVLIYDNGSHKRERGPALLQGHRGESGQQRDCLGIHRQSGLQFLQRLHLGRPPPAQRQHADHRGAVRAHVPGNSGIRSGLGIHQPAFPCGRGRPAGESRLPGHSLPERGHSLAAVGASAIGERAHGCAPLQYAR